jgi:hypothetical protein
MRSMESIIRFVHRPQPSQAHVVDREKLVHKLDAELTIMSKSEVVLKHLMTQRPGAIDTRQGYPSAG